MELKDYVRLLRRRWWVLVLCMALGGVGALVATTRQTKVYGSSFTLFLSDRQGHPVSPLIADSSQSRFASYATLAGSEPVQALIFNRTGIAGGYAVSAVGVPSTIFLRLTTTAGSPQTVYAIAKAYADVFPTYVSRFEGSGGTGTALRVFEPPRLGAALISPDKRRNVEVGLALGLIVGLGVLLLLEALDNKVRDVTELERMTDVGVAAAVPMEFRGEQLICERQPRSQRAEAIRLVRTNVQFAGIGGPLRTLVVTSPGAGEGKTSVATDLAIACAQAGQRVVLVDADLRKPRVAEVFALPTEPGVTNVLVGDVELAEVLIPWGEGQLGILPSGTRPAKPSELLASAKMGRLISSLREAADLVIIDSAPVLPVADTIGLLAHADAVLLVVRVGGTTRTQLRATLDRLHSVDSRIVGVVANGGHTSQGDGYYAYGPRRKLFSRRRRHVLLEVPTAVVTPDPSSQAEPRRENSVAQPSYWQGDAAVVPEGQQQRRG